MIPGQAEWGGGLLQISGKTLQDQIRAGGGVPWSLPAPALLQVQGTAGSGVLWMQPHGVLVLFGGLPGGRRLGMCFGETGSAAVLAFLVSACSCVHLLFLGNFLSAVFAMGLRKFVTQ